jgi:D-sedoheptulose 7-phosphate isomerase
VIHAQIRAQIEDSFAVKQALLADAGLLAQVQQLSEDCLTALRAGGKIVFAGNGGSFADAQHLSAEFTSRFLFDWAPLDSVVLAANSSAIRAIVNDTGYEFVLHAN